MPLGVHVVVDHVVGGEACGHDDAQAFAQAGEVARLGRASRLHSRQVIDSPIDQLLDVQILAGRAAPAPFSPPV